MATQRRGQVFRRCTQCGANLTGRSRGGQDRAERHAAGDCDGTDSTWSFIVDVAPPGAPRKQRRGGGFATKSEAVTAMNEMQTDYGRGTAVERSKITVGELLDGWLERQKLTKAPGTYENRRYRVAYMKPVIGEIPVQALTELDVERMAARLAESGKLRGDGGLKPASVAAVVSTLVTALNDAMRKRIVPRNVAAGAYRAPSRANLEEVFAWNADELARFLDVAANDPLYALWRFLAFTGCRIGEAIGLRWREVDLDAGSVTIVRTRSKGIDGQITVGSPKTARGRRTIDLDDETVAVLQQLRKASAVEQGTDAGRALVFTLPDGSPLHPDAVRTRMKRLVKTAGVPRLTPHGLRDSHATLLLLAGTPLHVVSRRLGHADEAFTARTYAAVLNGQGADAAATLAALVDGSAAKAEDL